MKIRQIYEKLIWAKKGKSIALLFDEKLADLGKIDYSKKR